MQKTRRVVTGEVGGKSVFASDEEIAPITIDAAPGLEFERVFGTAEIVVPNDGGETAIATYLPSPGGATLAMITIPPAPKTPPPANFDPSPLLKELDEKLPGLTDDIQDVGRMVHKTRTVDIVTVISGRAVLELDDGKTKELSPGDVVIQNGTRHAWRNPFDEPVLLHSVSIGGKAAP